MRALPRAFALLGRARDGRAVAHGNDQMRGIIFLLLSVFVFTLMDATAKYLAESYAPAQVVWARYMGNLAILLIWFRARFLPSLRTRQPMAQFLRALCQLASVSLFFTALQYIGLAEATAIMDLNPVLITL
ncbi:MAG: EamA family transporter, partial [Paracoccus sp. (in: a-proteobacteria)]|nr:EamA family transporter [Paracoccus sp. (in: a-proteobacteria)]